MTGEGDRETSSLGRREDSKGHVCEEHVDKNGRKCGRALGERKESDGLKSRRLEGMWVKESGGIRSCDKIRVSFTC